MIVVKEIFEDGMNFAHFKDQKETIDFLTPKECRKLMKEIQDGLFEINILKGNIIKKKKGDK